MSTTQSVDSVINEYKMTANSLQNALQSNNITQGEYKELIEDLIDLAQIQELAADIERKAMFSNLVDLLKSAIK